MATLGKRNLAVRIAIVSSNNLVRVGLRRIFEGHLGIVLVGESYGGLSARHLIEEARPDVIVIDLEPDMKLAEVISNFRRPAPLSRIIVLSGWDEIDCARQALAAGADGIVMKCQPPSVLLVTVECVAKSLAAPLSATSIPVLINDKRDKPLVDKVVAEPTRWIGSLTDRERSVIALVGQGLSNRDISSRLCVSETTVRHHLTSIFDKLRVSNRQKLLIYAHKYGLVELTAST